MRSQSYANELAEMNRQIQEQARRKQETLARIEQERKNRDILFEKELQREKQLQEQITNKQKKLDEEMLNSSNLTSERRINSSGQEKINKLNRELAEKKRALEEFKRQSQIRKNASQRQMEAYIEQLLK
jgi:hypothetical protein